MFGCSFNCTVVDPSQSTITLGCEEYHTVDYVSDDLERMEKIIVDQLNTVRRTLPPGDNDYFTISHDHPFVGRFTPFGDGRVVSVINGDDVIGVIFDEYDPPVVI